LELFGFVIVIVNLFTCNNSRRNISSFSVVKLIIIVRQVMYKQPAVYNAPL